MSTDSRNAPSSASRNAGSHPTIRQYLEYYGLFLGGRVIQWLPYRLLRAISVPFGSLVWLFDARGRAVARANLDAVFGDEMTPGKKAKVARASYQSFARSMLELFWSPNLNAGVMKQLASSEGIEPAFHHDPSQPVIYICLHASNFEWLSQNLAYAGRPAIVVTQQFRNPLLGPIFDRLRASTGHTIIPQERAMIRMLRHLKSGGIFCMVVDLNLDPREASVIIDEFSGLKTCVTQMHAALAQRTGALIVPAECRIAADGTYRMIHHKPVEYPEGASVAEITQLCWNALEPLIHDHPEFWLWSYKHWRFKPSHGDTSRYPFYANTSKRFDKLMKIHGLAPKKSAAIAEK